MRLLKLFKVTALLLVLAGCSMVSGCDKTDTENVDATEVNAILVGKWHLMRKGEADMSSEENYVTFTEDGHLIYELVTDGEKTTLKRLYRIDDNWSWDKKKKTYTGTITDILSSDSPMSCTISGDKLTTVDSFAERVYKKI
ncbi:hypothetical protein SAMN06298215_0214 [Bacteroidales bacterium WCE2008]|nr:hypothetical protein SAMN06298215_0214 [Bacteroidales bacterium WCE2008]